VAIRHKSAQKAHRQNVVRRDVNRQFRSRLRTALKDIRAAIDAGNQKQARAALNETVSLIDKMAGKGIIHVNAAGRYKSRIAKRLKSASA
jgi:small subunit ribosomal protein S20